MKTKKQMTMKTRSRNFRRMMYPISLLVAIFIVTSCNNSGGEKEKKTEKVEAPAMDMHSAVLLGDLKAVVQHINAGSELNQGDPAMGSTPLMVAAVFGRTEIAAALIEADIDLDITNNDGATALHSAAFLCRTAIVEMLLEHGADKSIRNNFGSTAGESVEAPFESVKFIYEQFNKDLGPLGLKLDFDRLEKTRPVIADLLK